MKQTTQTDPMHAFLTTRPQLFAVAYRMLGSVSDAEDIVQDTYLRWRQVAEDDVHNPAAFLRKVAVNLCLDHLKSAKKQREVYPGEWLPEPIALDEPVLQRDVSYAVLATMERLSALERAAYLLHDIFDMGYDELARTLQRSEASCRQLVTRARRHLNVGKQRHAVPHNKEEALTRAFFHASKTGDTRKLSQLLSEDAILISDGGGKAAAAINPIFGPAKILRLCVGLAAKSKNQLPSQWRYRRLNGQPGIISSERDGVLQASILEIKGGQICKIYVLRNPGKTAHLAELL